MKKLLLMCVFAVSFAAQAQITQKDLQGSWKLTGLNDGDVILDFEKRTARLTPESAEGFTALELKEEEAMVLEELDDYKEEYPEILVVTGNTIRAEKDGEQEVVAFTIENGKTLVTETNGQVERDILELKGKTLTVAVDGIEVTLIYTKL